MLETGETEAHCTLACLKMGAKLVLLSSDKKVVYQIDDQAKAKNFPAQNVVLVGTLHAATKTIRVADIVPEVSPRIGRARSVYIDCDSCVRGMAKANLAAIDALANWKRFAVVQDPKKADLVFLFSPNRYLGDYLTRKGPDQRPVEVVYTYMDVLDSHTGASLWSDSRRSGSLRIAGETKDLIDEFRAQLEATDGQFGRLLALYTKNPHGTPLEIGK